MHSKISHVYLSLKVTMPKTRESTSLNYPHDLHRRFKEDEYLQFDARVAKVDETCENRFMLAKKGYTKP